MLKALLLEEEGVISAPTPKNFSHSCVAGCTQHIFLHAQPPLLYRCSFKCDNVNFIIGSFTEGHGSVSETNVEAQLETYWQNLATGFKTLEKSNYSNLNVA